VTKTALGEQPAQKVFKSVLGEMSCQRLAPAIATRIASQNKSDKKHPGSEQDRFVVHAKLYVWRGLSGKMRTLLDLHGNIPTFIGVTSGDVHNVKILDEIMSEAGSFYVMVRVYIDFQRLFVFTLSSAFFVVRTKSNVLIQRRYSHPVDKSTGVCSDQTVILKLVSSKRKWRTILFFMLTRAVQLFPVVVFGGSQDIIGSHNRLVQKGRCQRNDSSRAHYATSVRVAYLSCMRT